MRTCSSVLPCYFTPVPACEQEQGRRHAYSSESRDAAESGDAASGLREESGDGATGSAASLQRTRPRRELECAADARCGASADAAAAHHGRALTSRPRSTRPIRSSLPPSAPSASRRRSIRHVPWPFQ
jgi:hypothetical protein